MHRNTLVFFDAACVVAASGSPDGGSAFILSVCRRMYLRAAGSRSVFVEAERNISRKMGDTSLNRYYGYLRDIAFEIVDINEASIPLRYRHIAGEKDAHVITAAIALSADYLITLDRKLANRITAATLPIIAMTPGEFIKGPLLQHPDRADFRDT